MKKLTLLTALAFIGASVSAQAQLSNSVIHLEGPSQSNDFVAGYNDFPLYGESFDNSDPNATNTTTTINNVASFVANTSDGSNTYNGGTAATTVNYLEYTYEDDADVFDFTGNTSNTEAWMGSDAAGVGTNGGSADTASASSGFIDNAVGNFDVTTGGTFKFSLAGDDAARITLAGNNILQTDYNTGTQTTTLTLAPGEYSFDLLYFQNGGGQSLTYSATSTDGGAFEYALAPEPSTIAMMAFGALGLGVVMFRRRAASI